MNKKMVTIIAALAMCTAMAGCTENDTASSSKAETTTTTTAAAESAAPVESTVDESSADSTSTNAGTTDYDVDGDFRAFEQLKEKYADGYLVTLEGQMSKQRNKIYYLRKGRQGLRVKHNTGHEVICCLPRRRQEV